MVFVTQGLSKGSRKLDSREFISGTTSRRVESPFRPQTRDQGRRRWNTSWLSGYFDEVPTGVPALVPSRLAEGKGSKGGREGTSAETFKTLWFVSVGVVNSSGPRSPRLVRNGSGRGEQSLSLVFPGYEIGPGQWDVKRVGGRVGETGPGSLDPGTIYLVGPKHRWSVSGK